MGGRSRNSRKKYRKTKPQRILIRCGFLVGAGGCREPRRKGTRVAAPSGCIVPWAARASCWPQPQQLLPVSAAGSGRRCCTGAFLPPDCSAGRCCSNPPTFVSLMHKQNKKLQRAKYARAFLVGAGGFEPPKLKAADLQSVPIGHSGTRPYSFVAHPYAGRLVYFSMRRGICQLSFLLFFSEFKQHPTKAGKNAMTGDFYGNRALLWCNCRKEKARII